MLDHTHQTTINELLQFIGLQPDFDKALDDPMLQANFLMHCQAKGVKYSLLQPQPLSLAFQQLQELVYRRKNCLLWNLLNRSPDLHPFCQLSLHLQLTPAEHAVLYWWLSERKAQLRALATETPYETTQPPMPVFYHHRQGVGKTRLMSALVKPLAHLVRPVTLDQLTDPNMCFEWGRLLVACVDELAGHNRHEISAFKSWMYAKEVFGRRLYTHNTQTITKITQPIATSNTPSSQLLYDPTGNRRHFDITVPENTHQIIPDFDWLHLWQSINPDYKPDQLTRELIQTAQKQQQPITSLDYWLEDQGDKLIKNGSREERGASNLYADYKVYCQIYASGKPTGRNRFTRYLADRSGYVKRLDKKGTYFQSVMVVKGW